MKETDMIFEYRASVRMHEVDTSGHAPLHVLLNYFQEAAGLHAERLNWGMSELLTHNVVWVLTRVAVEMTRYPKAGEIVIVRTCPVSSDKYSAKRDFIFLDQERKELGKGASNWVMMNIENRCMMSIPPVFQNMFARVQQPQVFHFEGKKIACLEKVQQKSTILARLEDIDLNGHVNNTHFIAWALESAPKNYASAQLKAMDIQFRAEVKRNQSIVSCTGGSTAEPDALFHSLRCDMDNREVARAKSLWQFEKQHVLP